MELAVIGRGLMGAAAARHLSAAGHAVTLIGPDEPADYARHTGVFASHYDEGRITRHLATDMFWSEVASASIDRYAKIEADSGIRFYTPTGSVMLAPTDSADTARTAAVQAARGLQAEVLDSDGLAQRLPFFTLPPDMTGFLEAAGGHISPRALVAAQTAIAHAQGTRLVRSPATALREGPDGVTIHTAEGAITAARVLVAAGAMTDHLLERPTGQWVHARTVAFFHIDAPEAARLAAMPSAVLRLPVAGEPYLLPPIRYPDGSIRVKLGGDPFDIRLETPEAIADHFRSGGAARVRDHLVAVLGDLMPDLAVRSVSMAPCVTTYTAHGTPTIARHTARIAVLSAGNGAGAKCSDELGRRGALTLLEDSDAAPALS